MQAGRTSFRWRLAFIPTWRRAARASIGRSSCRRCGIWRSIPTRFRSAPTSSRLPPQRFELSEREFDDGFDSVADPARFAVTAGERRIELELTDGYPCAQVYAPLDGHFICFEPMTAPANALRSGDGLRLLAPGERYRAGFSLGLSQA